MRKAAEPMDFFVVMILNVAAFAPMVFVQMVLAMAAAHVGPMAPPAATPANVADSVQVASAEMALAMAAHVDQRD